MCKAQGPTCLRGPCALAELILLITSITCRVIGVALETYFVADSMNLYSFNFSGGLRNFFIYARVTFRPFRVVQDH